ncbi:endogenous retrovirus group K member 113 Pol protein-like [Elysia marginata]|uniref:Endogenous retrovirus group K member 113 Pol protein-like n=1 Tax=Elysia marginata TaxID=1093978 RepID=A0AAV4JKX2_9GAST|nr:endogenous retrovirus group K member 113 Pol protein-like [Elysia marginata]
MVDVCDRCQEQKPRNAKLPLLQHGERNLRWEKVACGLFEIQGRHYMVTVDYFSNFIEVDYQTSISTKSVITKLKGNFARYGVPKMLVTDSGSQYSSTELGVFTSRWGIHHTMSAPSKLNSLVSSKTRKTNDGEDFGQRGGSV